MHDFAIIAEGITDQVLIRELLFAYFGSGEAEPTVNFVQPDVDKTAAKGVPDAGGWTLVKRYLQEGQVLEALQTNSYAVIHVDTDIAGDLGVPASVVGDQAILQAAIAVLRAEIGGVPPEVASRILYAIGVDSSECWLLQLVFDRSQRQKRRKTTGCLQAVNHALRKAGDILLEKGGKKCPEAYRRLAARWRKRNDIETENPGLEHFLEQLDGCFQSIAP